MTAPTPQPGREPLACDAFLVRATESLDRPGENLEPDVLAHAEACDPCRAWLRAVRVLRQGLEVRARPVPPEGLSDRILEAALADRRAARREWLVRRFAPVAALAAAVVVVAWIAVSQFGSPPGPGPAPPPEVVAVPEGVREPAGSPPHPLPSLRDSLSEAGTALVGLTRRTAEETRQLLPTPGPLPTGEVRMLASLDPAAQSLAEARQGAAEGLSPVTGSARRAMDLFLREFAIREADAKP
jgi:hypothetical protein